MIMWDRELWMQLLLSDRAYRLMLEHFINWLLFNSVYCSFSNFRFLLFASYITFPTVVQEVLYYCPIAFWHFMILSCSLLCRLCVRSHSGPFSCSLCITGCTVAQHCCNDDQQSQWENGDFDPRYRGSISCTVVGVLTHQVVNLPAAPTVYHYS